MVGWNCRIEKSCEPGIENLSHKRRVSVAIECDGAGNGRAIRKGNLGNRLISQLIAKVVSDLGGVRNQTQVRYCLAHAQAFVVSEEERLVFNDWAAESEAELVLPVSLLAERLKRIGGIELVVSQELPSATVQTVGA